jgi:subtilisin family serine protease
MTTYNVALNKDVDYDSFWNEIESDGSGSTYVPYRSVDIVNERPVSLRQCWYDLTDEEAEKLSNDPRVYCVEIPPEHRDDFVIELYSNVTQTGLWYKGPNPTYPNPGNTAGLNWGLPRISSKYNVTYGNSGPFTYNSTLDGTGVDVIISDSGCQCNHPEFNDSNGVSRIQQINWFTESGVTGTMPVNFYSDPDGHGTHVTGTTAGVLYGHAKNARIYIMNCAGSADLTYRIPITQAFDCMLGWQNNKPVDPVTGLKRPTVLNMSWGLAFTYASVTNMVSVTYRGTTYPTTVPLSQYGMVNVWGRSVSSLDVQVQELIDAGVICVAAAGNDSNTRDVPGGLDYNNYFTRSNGSQNYYMRPSSPSVSLDVICVAAIGNVTVDSSWSDNPEKIASYSTTGPRIDILAPGSAIISAWPNPNPYGVTAQYPPNTNFLIANIDGTSMASPQIAGIAALFCQKYPSYTSAQMKSYIQSIATPNMLYTTGSTTDYADVQSLRGAPNLYAYNPYNSLLEQGFSVEGAVTMNNTTMTSGV